MATTFVLKIKYADTLRRITVQASPSTNGPDLSYSQLEDIIRQTFKLPVSLELVITYTDMDNDVVTMAGDQDLQDACVNQGLNPLRLQVTTVASSTAATPDYIPPPPPPPFTGRFGHHPHPHHHHHHGGPPHHHGGGPHGPQGRHHGRHHGRPQNPPNLKNIVESTMKFSQDTAKQTADHVTQVLQACEPLIKNAPKQVVSEVMDSIAKAFAALPTGINRDDLAHPFLAAFPFGHPSSSSTPLFGPAAAPVPPSASPVDDQSIPSSKAPNVSGDAAAATAQEEQPVLHYGVVCDMCNMTPIVGPRYKSLKEHNYDLCQACFEEHGRAEDYDRIDRPLFRPRHLHPPMFGVSLFGSGGSGGKLDARFVQDVTIFDGTELAPGTQFTKIWRLRNSGSLAWPQHTQLVHVGGDEMGPIYAATLELPEHGLAPDDEVEVSVDLVAPERPGRYVSHWRLVAPAGPKFGHRVWVLIQVLLKQIFATSVTFLALLLVVEKDEESPQMVESLVMPRQDTADQEKEDEVLAEVPVVAPDTLANTGVSVTQLEGGVPVVNTVSAAVPSRGENDLIMFETNPVATQPQEDTDKIEYPVIDRELTAPIVVDFQMGDAGKGPEEAQDADMENSELGNFSMVDMPVQPSNDFGGPSIEREQIKAAAAAAETDPVDAIVANLEAMGFTQRSLNLELLKKNDNDMQRTIDDLVTASEWDPMLEELEEMGFYDTEMNRRLMFKNNGSVKRVVKELVQMYKDPAGSGKGQV
ncbi:unnamed protein product [Sphagnum compactum]